MEINEIVNYVMNTPTNSNPAVLRSMLTTLTESGSGGLPEVSEADNGDVLTVVEGAWAKAAPSGGGGGVFLVNYTLTIDETTHEISVTNCDKTYAEIVSAAETQYPIAVLRLGTNAMQIPFDGISDNQITFKKSSINIVDAGGGSTQIGFIVTEVTHNSVAYMHYSEGYAEITTT